MNRRDFLASSMGTIAAASASSIAAGGVDKTGASWDPDRPLIVTGKPLVVQPVFMHNFQTPREKTSWRSWSKISTPEAAAEERKRISQELSELASKARFPMEILPLVEVTSVEEAAKVHGGSYDVVLVYPATGSGDMLRACFPRAKEKDALVFVRHKSGPVYYWYEALSTRYLKKNTPEETRGNSADDHGGPTVDDVVVDDYAELMWRLRALYGLKNFVGHRIVALGGPAGKYDPKAPEAARQRFKVDIVTVGYDDYEKRMKAARKDRGLVAQAEKWTDRYLQLPNTVLATEKPFVVNAFLLHKVIKDWLREHEAPAFTIFGCMGRALPIAETTPCMPLGWLNDEGYAAFCESDFVIVPCGVFLHYMAGTPIFMHNSTFPHKGIVTCAHCSAPRRMDGIRYEPTRVVTHYESDYGAAPKVAMAIGQQVTFSGPRVCDGPLARIHGSHPRQPLLRNLPDPAGRGDPGRLEETPPRGA